MMKQRKPLTIIYDRGAEKLIEGIYWQAVRDIVEEWKREEELDHHTGCYNSAVAFLNKTQRGRRLLRILKGCTAEQRQALMNRTPEVDVGTSYKKGRKPDGETTE